MERIRSSMRHPTASFCFSLPVFDFPTAYGSSGRRLRGPCWATFMVCPLSSGYPFDARHSFPRPALHDVLSSLPPSLRSSGAAAARTAFLTCAAATPLPRPPRLRIIISTAYRQFVNHSLCSIASHPQSIVIERHTKTFSAAAPRFFHAMLTLLQAGLRPA